MIDLPIPSLLPTPAILQPRTKARVGSAVSSYSAPNPICGGRLGIFSSHLKVLRLSVLSQPRQLSPLPTPTPPTPPSLLPRLSLAIPPTLLKHPNGNYPFKLLPPPVSPSPRLRSKSHHPSYPTLSLNLSISLPMTSRLSYLVTRRAPPKPPPRQIQTPTNPRTGRVGRSAIQTHGFRLWSTRRKTKAMRGPTGKSKKISH